MILANDSEVNIIFKGRTEHLIVNTAGYLGTRALN